MSRACVWGHVTAHLLAAPAPDSALGDRLLSLDQIWRRPSSHFRLRLRHRNGGGHCHCGCVLDRGTDSPLSSTHEASSRTDLGAKGAELSSRAREHACASIGVCSESGTGTTLPQNRPV